MKCAELLLSNGVKQHRTQERQRSAERCYERFALRPCFTEQKPSSENQTFTFQDTSALFVLKIVILIQILPANTHSSRK